LPPALPAGRIGESNISESGITPKKPNQAFCYAYLELPSYNQLVGKKNHLLFNLGLRSTINGKAIN